MYPGEFSSGLFIKSMSKLEDLQDELERVENMTELEVMKAYNSDSKKAIIQLIKEDIIIEESSEYNESDGMDYDGLCYSQGISRYC